MPVGLKGNIACLVQECSWHQILKSILIAKMNQSEPFLETRQLIYLCKPDI